MAEPEFTGGCILLVDDFDDAREMYGEFLASLGHRVLTAADGHAALEAAEREQLDLIILDIGLPRLDGIAVIRLLRAREGTRRTPIITLSAMVEDGMRTAAVEAGADLALDKPCLPMELEIAVRAFLQHGSRPDKLRTPADQI